MEENQSRCAAVPVGIVSLAPPHMETSDVEECYVLGNMRIKHGWVAGSKEGGV